MSATDDGLSSATKRRIVIGAIAVGVLAVSPRSRRLVRKGVSTLVSGLGFVTHTVWDLTGGRRKTKKWEVALSSLDDYLTKSGLKEEWTNVMNHRFLDNISLIEQLQNRTPNIETELAIDPAAKNNLKTPTAEEAARYMRFATAVYGYAMIRSVEIAMNPEVPPGLTTEEAVLRHTYIADKSDLIYQDIDYGTGMESLRHMVAVDHANKAVVFSVRGTFDLSGVVVDLVGYTVPFCGGEAHAGIADMARAVWNKTKQALAERVNEVPDDYELIITGHSLGAGVACLITIMAFHDKLLPPHVNVRCLAYAPPPVFHPLDAAPEAVAVTTAYVNSFDCVPSLSMSSVRHTFAQVAAFERELKHEPYFKRLRMGLGWADIPERAVNAALAARHSPPPELKGAPMLVVPAKALVWLKEDNASMEENLSIETVLCDPLKKARFGIYLSNTMFPDHFPSNYQLALENAAQKERFKNEKMNISSNEKDRLL